MEEPCRKLILNNEQLGGLVGRFPGEQYFSMTNQIDAGIPSNICQPFGHLNIGPPKCVGGGNGPTMMPANKSSYSPSIGFNMDYINEQLKYSGGEGSNGPPMALIPFDSGQHYYGSPQKMDREMDCQRRQQCPDEGIAKLICGFVDLLGKQGHRGNGTNSPKKDPSDKLRKRCDNIGNFLGDAAHRFLGVNPRTGQIIGSIAGNVLFHFGGKDNKLGITGTIILDNILSGKFRRKIDPFIKPDRIPRERPSTEPTPIPPYIYDAKEMNFYAQRDRCLKQKRLFEDPDFPANDSSLFFSRRPPESTIWLRPGQIVREPQLIVEGHTRFDVIQGKLGNCWLMAAVANLTLAEELFYRVVPPDQSFTQNYAGIFHFQFWQYGRWLDVIVDDRLPCSRNGELLYMHSCDLNEFWSALLEKAYAKLYGSYEALRGGTTGEALEDMTGGLTEFIELEYPPINLVQMMARGFAMGSLFGCSIEADPYIWEAKLPNGLVKGHAYSITGIRSVPTQSGQQVLLRIRNPWGNDQEWRGPWSDRSPEWRQLSDGLKRDIALHFEHDGEFWMSFEDFVRNFEKLEICHLGPEVLEEIYQMTGMKSAVRQNWSTRVHHGAWRRYQNAGGCRNYLQTFASNPQIRIKITGPYANAFNVDGRNCTVIIAVMQKYRREKKYLGMENLAIGFSVYQTNTIRGRLGKQFFAQNHSYARSPAFINLREVSAHVRLAPGEYVIVPSTYEPNEEGEFMVRIYANGFLESWDL